MIRVNFANILQVVTEVRPATGEDASAEAEPYRCVCGANVPGTRMFLCGWVCSSKWAEPGTAATRLISRRLHQHLCG